MTTETDAYWMKRALELAAKAAQAGEVPVGALLVADGAIVGTGYNQPICSHDPTAHAEVVAIRQAAETRRNYRLPDCTLYVTLEPCTMCIGAMVHARIHTLVFAAREPRFGAVISSKRLLDEEDAFNHRISWREGVLAAESAALLQGFFRQRRGTGTAQS